MTFTKYLSIEKKIIINPHFESAGQNLVNAIKTEAKFIYLQIVYVVPFYLIITSIPIFFGCTLY